MASSNLQINDRGIMLWGIHSRLAWQSTRIVRAFMWDTCDEGLALQMIEDHAWFINKKGKFGLSFDEMKDIAAEAFDRAQHALECKFEPVFLKMCDAATTAYLDGGIRAGARAAADVARSSDIKPPPSYVALASDEAITRVRINYARAKRSRS